MRIELLAIGDELLDGTIIDSNSSEIGGALHARGLSVARVTRLPDDRAVLVDAMRAIAARADVCVCTGGLGPTDDDLTLDALAEAAGVGRRPDAKAWEHIVGIYGERTPPESNRRQASIPVGGEALYSEVGTAPGVLLDIEGCRFFALPGVPREMRWFVDRYVLPALDDDGRPQPTSRTLRFVGIGESSLAARIDLAQVPAGVELSYLARLPEVHVRMRGLDADAVGAAAEVIRAAAPMRCLPDTADSLPAAVIQGCKAAGLTVGAAESCTGGLVGALMTDVSGASAVFHGSVVSYSNAVKQGVLKVPEAVLIEHGAVSEACARAMVAGAQAALGCDLAVSITGIAGPGGGTPDKPVGTVWFAWAGPRLDGRAEVRRFRGDRARVRTVAAAHALDVIRRALLDGGAR